MEKGRAMLGTFWNWNSQRSAVSRMEAPGKAGGGEKQFLTSTLEFTEALHFEMERKERKGLEERQEFSLGHAELKVSVRQPVGNENWAGGHMVLEFELELLFRILSWNSLYSLKLLAI